MDLELQMLRLVVPLEEDHLLAQLFEALPQGRLEPVDLGRNFLRKFEAGRVMGDRQNLN